MHHQHREKLYNLFNDDRPGIVYLQGGSVQSRYDTDYDYPFRQESNFLYLTGVNEPDFHMILDLHNHDFHLFVPKRDPQFAVWNGYIRSQSYYQELYEADAVHYDSELPKVIKDLNPDIIYCYNDRQTELLDELDIDAEINIEALEDALTYCRTIKTSWELDQLRYAGKVNNEAHRQVMKAIGPDKYEYEMKAVFEYNQVKYGLVQDAYAGIFASGPNSAILHYVTNDSYMNDGDLFLIDAGHEYNGYSSDITRTFPVNGTFTTMQADVYDTVLRAQKDAIEAAVPGNKMEDLHLLAARRILEGLVDMGLVKGDIDEMLEKNIFALFFPHGLGHFLGLDTHDVGGYPKGVERIQRPGLKYLRVRRELEPGMVLTIEPGLYFIPALLEPAFDDEEKAPYLNRDKLSQLFDFGGVRIEDNIVVTEGAPENMTDVPKERKDVEKLIQQ